MWKNMTVYSLQQPLYKKEDQTGFSLRAMCRLSKCKTSAHYAGLLQHTSTAKHKRNSLFWWNFFPFIHSFSFCSPCQYFRNVCFWNAIKSHELIKWLSYIMVGNTTSSGGFFFVVFGEPSCVLLGLIQEALLSVSLVRPGNTVGYLQKRAGLLKQQAVWSYCRWMRNNSVLWYIKLKVSQRKGETQLLCSVSVLE